jgi:MIP family channel proteins
VTFGSARVLAAEAIGTFALVCFGCGAIMVDEERGSLGLVGISFAFGLVVMAMVFALGHISGAHINPAVTFALAIRSRFPWSSVPGYWGAQLTGAIAAAVFLWASLGDVADLGSTTPSGSDAQSFVWELVMTATLLVVILAVATDARTAAGIAAIAIGGTIALASFVGGPISGASLNPARSLGPALVSGDLGSIWIYLTAPVVGGVLGALAYDALRPGSPP